MTQFIDTTREKKEIKETIFTHILDINNGYEETKRNPKEFDKVLYLGICANDGDMFSAHHEDGCIQIFKGIKGNEF